MSVATLGQSLLAKPAFQARLDSLTVDSVALQFPGLTREIPAVPTVDDWQYFLMCASLLAQAPESNCEEAALRIAHHCLTSDLPPSFHDAACVIFDTLTNRPAIGLAQRRHLVEANVAIRLPLKLMQDWVKREIQQTVVTGRDEELSLNRFQLQMWNLANTADHISVSAPTSTGKSFAFCHWLSSYILSSGTSSSSTWCQRGH